MFTVFTVNTGVTATLSGLTITAGVSDTTNPGDLSDTSTYGGGIVNNGTLTVADVAFFGNSATYGGGVYNNGALTINDSSFSDNDAADGGGILSGGTLTVRGSIFSDNSATNDGGGIYGGGSQTVSDCTFSDNSATYNGGGMFVAGSPITVTGSTFSGNSASYGDGGGIWNGDVLMVSDCTFSTNSASNGGGNSMIGGDGGAIFNDNGTLTVTDSTLSANTASGNNSPFKYNSSEPLGPGAGIYSESDYYYSAPTTLNGDILVGNIISGPYSDQDNLDCTDTDSNATVEASSSDNLIGANSLSGNSGYQDGLMAGQNGNQVGPADLAPLGYYGGPTETFALLPGSKAIGMGVIEPLNQPMTPPPTDQRGAVRPSDGVTQSDVGAFQDQGYTLTASPTTPQDTTTGMPFPQSLTVTLTENFLGGQALSGATITYSAPASGASAALGSPTPTLTGDNGQTGVTATANSIGGSYLVTASDDGADTTTFMLTNDAPTAPPIVTTNPSDVTITLGQPVTFTAAASGSPTPEVQWQVEVPDPNGGKFTNIAGATDVTYSFVPAVGDSGNEYEAVFTNAGGSATSNPALLTANLPITLKPGVLPDGTFKATYSEQMITASGGTGPILLTFNVTNAVPGLMIASTGGQNSQGGIGVVGIGPGNSQGGPGNALSVTGTLTATGTETFTVIGTDETGASTKTIYSITVNPTNQTINFSAPTSPILFVRNEAIALSAMASSGDSVVFSIDLTSIGSGSISDDTLTVTGAGNIVIDAALPINSDPKSENKSLRRM